MRYEDIAAVEALVLDHRRRETPPPERRQTPSEESDSPDETDGPADAEQSSGDSDEQESSAREVPQEASPHSEPDLDRSTTDGKEKEVFETGRPYRVRPIRFDRDRIVRRGSGKRARTRTAQKQGRYVRARPDGPVEHDIAVDATIRAAAPFQRIRRGEAETINGDAGSSDGGTLAIRDVDFRHKVRERRIGTYFHFLVDASGSMGARARMVATKGAVLSLLLDAYQKRDRVSMTAFRGEAATPMLPPTSSVEVAATALRELPVGGRTPLSAGLVHAGTVLRNELAKDPTARPVVIVITDGRANVALGDGPAHTEALDLAGKLARDPRVRFIVIDTEPKGFLQFGFASDLAGRLGAEYLKTEELRASELTNIVRAGSTGES